MNPIQGAVLGLVQGLGEFLPISSSGHMLLASKLMNLSAEDNSFKLVEIMMHVGTLIPVLVIFWRDWIDMLAHPIKNRTLLLLLIASLPTLGVYLAFGKVLDGFDSGWFLGVSFLISSVLLLVTELMSWSETRCRRESPSIPQALLMGVMQGLGLMPGVSRSGSTIFGGVAGGVTREGAAKFSFMMSAPAIAAAFLKEGYSAFKDEAMMEALKTNIMPIGIGVVIACVTGFLAIKFMMKLIKRVSLAWFALYMAALGLVVLLAQMNGLPQVPPFVVPTL